MLQLVEGRRKLIRDDSSGLGRLVSVVLFCDTASQQSPISVMEINSPRVLGSGILADLLLNILDVAVV
jgi:hypothetical protein